ncbi:aldo/keto reductase [Algoriphagus terrigena]|uniref:aldo/keto reductase n=1 Tax=Algoriphagus terrigena TaxID=344884 RepID=UPI0003FA9DAF|nr:aldo/keto reductase [Algoriphagus terrigena]
MSNSSDSVTLRLPQIALGCMSLPEPYAEAEEILQSAIDSGITFFDTADLYQQGKNEENIGKALRSKRSSLVLATKVGNQWNPDGKSWSWNPRKEYILKAVEESLKRLQTDYIDLYQLHGGTLEDPWEETLEAFELLKSQGKIRAFGISSIRPNVIRKVMAMIPPVTIMMQYSPLDRRPEETVFPMLQETATRVLVRGSLARGILIDKPAASFLDFPKEKVSEIKAEIQDSRFSPEAILIRFGLSERAVSSLVIGASSVEQVEKLQKGYEESRAIPDELVLWLKATFPKNFYQDHR